MRIHWLLVLAACGDPGAPLAPDASRDAADLDGAPDGTGDAADLSCLGMPPPATTGAMTVTGKVFAVVRYEVAPEIGAIVELRGADDSVVATAATDADGAFAFAVPGPVDGSFVATANGKRVTRATTDTPLVAGEDALLLVADDAEIARWYADAGVAQTGTRTVIAAVRDCARHSAGNSTLAISPAAIVTYYDEPAKRWDPALPASTNGFALITNAPATATVTPGLGATAFPAESLAPRANELTLAVISPFD